MFFSKKDIIKSSWKLLDDLIKILKDIYDNPLCSRARDEMWKAIKSSMEFLEYADLLKEGSFYAWAGYNKEKVIFLLEGFTVDNGHIMIQARVLTSTVTEFRYRKVENKMLIVPSDIRECEQIEVKPEDVPLYVSNAFNGTLMQEMLNKKKK